MTIQSSMAKVGDNIVIHANENFANAFANANFASAKQFHSHSIFHFLFLKKKERNVI